MIKKRTEPERERKISKYERNLIHTQKKKERKNQT